MSKLADYLRGVIPMTEAFSGSSVLGSITGQGAMTSREERLKKAWGDSMVKWPNTNRQFIEWAHRLPKGASVIYGLVDPRTMALRYVGKSEAPAHRMRQHLKDESKNHRVNWIKRLLSEGVQPMPILILVCPSCLAGEMETKVIRMLKAKGADLVNSTEGGEDLAFTPEVIKKRNKSISQSMKGRRMSPEHYANYKAARSGKPKSEAWKRSRSLSMRVNNPRCGKRLTPEERTRLSVAHAADGARTRGVPRDEEHRRRTSEGLRMWWKRRKGGVL